MDLNILFGDLIIHLKRLFYLIMDSYVTTCKAMKLDPHLIPYMKQKCTQSKLQT